MWWPWAFLERKEEEISTQPDESGGHFLYHNPKTQPVDTAASSSMFRTFISLLPKTSQLGAVIGVRHMRLTATKDALLFLRSQQGVSETVRPFSRGVVTNWVVIAQPGLCRVWARCGREK